ncbi:Patatin-like phospholipase [Duganella sacchari]|uniref:Patatin-like phospholipase n=2 Tax=Duganella sacchari TaxID=551987 RepID=A0A1M7R9M1_9BURK|nr:Patatin-like phospholipase [Duganella sacchari]
MPLEMLAVANADAVTPVTVLPDLAGGYYSVAPTVPKGTFDLGLVMAGAISAGAYTAGVLDFLIEAMDAFETEKAKRRLASRDPLTWDVPGHDVRLRIMSGASAGSIVSAVAAVALRYQFPHVKSSTTNPSANPFYRAWVSDIDISNLLQAKDLQGNKDPVTSLLDSTSLQSIGDTLLGYGTAAGQGEVPRANRPYLSSPVRYVFSINNLRGVPYFVPMNSNIDAGFGMVKHGDYIGFAVDYGAGKPRAAKLDDVGLAFPNSVSSWSGFTGAALASGAFPAFLAPRPLSVPGTRYVYRFVLAPADTPDKVCAVQVQPKWIDDVVPAPYTAMLVDGGTINNEPLEWARSELAGIAGRCPRAGDDADRATILIDPFPDYAAQVDDPKRGQSADLFSALAGLVGGWKSQARFASGDLALAEASSVYSRFLIAPDRDKSPESAKFDLACGALGGFSGFLAQSFRQHDYLLGRRNCQQFLRTHFAVPVTNNQITTAINPALLEKSAWLVERDGKIHMPLIPLFGSLAEEEPLPRWPTQAFLPETLITPIAGRVKAVLDRLVTNKAPWLLKALYSVLSPVFGGLLCRKLATQAVQAIRKELEARNLAAALPSDS